MNNKYTVIPSTDVKPGDHIKVNPTPRESGTSGIVKKVARVNATIDTPYMGSTIELTVRKSEISEVRRPK